jgi:hypothetical protein
MGMPPNTHPERHDIGLEVWSVVSPLPRLFRRVSEYILSSHAQDPPEVMELMLRCYRARQKIEIWRVRFEKDMDECPHKRNDDHRYRGNLGVAMAAQCMVQRLIVALEPRSGDALRLERQVHELAEGLIAFSGDRCPRLDVVLAQKYAIADAVLRTKDMYLQAAQGSTDGIEAGRTHINRQIFGDFCTALGRRIDF